MNKHNILSVVILIALTTMPLQATVTFVDFTSATTGGAAAGAGGPPLSHKTILVWSTELPPSEPQTGIPLRIDEKTTIILPEVFATKYPAQAPQIVAAFTATRDRLLCELMPDLPGASLIKATKSLIAFICDRTAPSFSRKTRNRNHIREMSSHPGSQNIVRA